MENTNKKEQNTIACDLKEFEVGKSKYFILNIGRNQNCYIIIEYMMLSKIQCRIEYGINNKCFYLKKKRTNRTRVFILNQTEITKILCLKLDILYLW